MLARGAQARSSSLSLAQLARRLRMVAPALPTSQRHQQRQQLRRLTAWRVPRHEQQRLQAALGGAWRSFSQADGAAGAGVRRSAAAGGSGAGPSAGAAPTRGGAPGKLPLVVNVDASNLEQVMAQSFGVPTILDCHAEWCGPCKQLAPVLEDLVKRSGGRLRLAKLDVDRNQEISAQLRVQSLPTVFGIASGKVVDQFIGLPQQQRLQAFVDKLLSSAPTAAGGGAGPGGSGGANGEAFRSAEEIVGAGVQAMLQGDFGTAQHHFETVIALEQSDQDALKGKTGRAAMKTEEQLRTEEAAAAAHADLAQVLLMAGDGDAAREYAANFRKQPKWAKYLDTRSVAQPLAYVQLYAGNDGLEMDPEKLVAKLVGFLSSCTFALACTLVVCCVGMLCGGCCGVCARTVTVAVVPCRCGAGTEARLSCTLRTHSRTPRPCPSATSDFIHGVGACCGMARRRTRTTTWPGSRWRPATCCGCARGVFQ
jgi:thioredoxin